MVARFGGDEFALVLPDTGSEGAAAVGDRIRDRIAAFSFLQGDGLDIKLTVSVGVATLPDVAASADGSSTPPTSAMYWVKEHGKNGIYVRRELNVADVRRPQLQGVIVESSFSVLAVLERSRDRSRDGQHLRLRARARASSSTSRRSSPSTR